MTTPLSDEQKAENTQERRRRAADRSWERNFLIALEQTGNVTRAAKAAHTTRTTAY